MTVRTRFAPSPTGRLHLGHALAAITAHDLARQTGGRVLLRIEDIEKQRLLETTDTVERLATILPLIQSQIESRRPSGYYRATSDMLREWVTPN